MFTVMLFMIAGFCLGLVLRRKRMPFIARFVTILVWLLLFLLGVEVWSAVSAASASRP